MSLEQKTDAVTDIRSKIKARANLLKHLRAFFEARGVLEVETPLLGLTNCPDQHIDPFFTELENRQQKLVLQSSPEFYMKRLLAQGSGSIYQIGKAFRNSEIGHHHNPEFTMVEWYRQGWTYDRLILEVVELLQEVLSSNFVKIIDYQSLFMEYLQLDPWQANIADYQQKAKALQLTNDLDLCPDGWLDFLLTHAILPKLDANTLWVIKDFPPTQAALANVGVERGNRFGQRFECYYQGIELANGYDELTCVATHQERFKCQNQKRQEAGKPALPLDEAFLEALDTMPACAGVALGFDRLLMLQTQKSTIQDVLTFPYQAL